MYLHYGAMALAAGCLAAGFYYRVSVLAFFVLFTYAQLIDISNYLNHYYLAVLLAGLLVVLPAGQAWAFDTWRRPERRQSFVPAWVVYLLRVQVGVVYVYASLAKFTADWLLEALPLRLWLRARTHFPVIGPWLSEQWVAYVMSWSGFVYDGCIVLLLLVARTRPFAYAAVVIFHGLTYAFFDIGMFPFIMVTSTLIFFSPSWPRRLWCWVRRWKFVPESPSTNPLRPSSQRGRAWVVAALGLYALTQVLFPLRHYAYPGDVLWNEQGMRFSWKVLVREKNGSVTYHVRERRSGRRYDISPHDYLTWAQVSEMSSQPDLILKLAHLIADDLKHQGRGPVEIRAEAWASLNGRPAMLMLDETRDLVPVRDDLWPADWIRRGPTDAAYNGEWVRR